MRSAIRRRSLGALVATCVLSACGGSPAAPDPPTTDPIATGPQVLRITPQSSCPGSEGRVFIPFVYTRVTVSRSGSDWVAAASTLANGDVELRFRSTGTSGLTGSLQILGTIRGVAIHSPDLVPGVPAWEARASFTGSSTLVGTAFGVTNLTPMAGVSGVGSGTIAVSDGGGQSCAGTFFSWALGAPP